MRAKTDGVVLFERHNHLFGKKLQGRHFTIERDYPTHSHDYFEIELIVEGTGKQVLNGQELPLAPGTFYLLTPEDIHSVQPDGPLTHYNISFEEDFFSDFLSFERLMACPGKQVELVGEDYHRMVTLMQQLLDESKNSNLPHTHSYMQSLLNCILIELLRYNEAENIQSTDSSMRHILFYVLRHFREPITMESVAAYAHLSTSYFCKTFKKVTGQCFTDYLTNLRVRFAARLLHSTTTGVTDVCFQSGFNSFSSFSRSFKRHFGVTPTTYRNQHNRS